MNNEEKIYLLEALLVFSKLYKKPVTLETIIDGLPLTQEVETKILFSLKNKGLEDIFSRVAERAGFNATLIKEKKLNKIPKILFPIILLLEENKACILLEFSKNNKLVKVIIPEMSDKPYWVDLKGLEKEFMGAFFLLKPQFKEEDNKEKIDERHWFWGSLSYSKGIYFDVVIASLLLNIFMLATPLFTMNVYDRVVPNSAFDTLWVFSIAIITVYIFDTLMKTIRTYTLEVAAKKSDVIISSKLFEYVLKIKLAHKFPSVGSFASNLREFDHIRSFLSSSTIAVLIDIPFVLLFLWVIFIIGGEIVIVPIIASLVIIVYSLIIKYPLKTTIDKVSKSSAYKSSVLIESLNILETIKSFSLQGQMQWRWEESVGKIAKDEIKSRILSNSITNFSNLVIQLSSVAVLVLGVYAISKQQLTMGGLIALVMLSSRTLAPLNQFATLISNYEYAKSSYNMLNEIMKIPTDYSLEQRFVHRNNLKGVVEFKNVKFRYPNSNHYILDDVSFKISEHEKVGIIGTNGSGKTTILKLIMGLYEPESGVILIDGIEIHQLNPYDLRRAISYVPQDIVLFKGTLQENIVYSIKGVSDEQLIEVSQMSGVESFIAQHPLGYNMEIHERGDGISGGQKQAIGVARAFINSHANLVLMDEPTNSMDSTREALVEKSIENFSQKKTMIMVSHKNSLLQKTERLILLQNGKILLDDTYKNVLFHLSQKKEVV